MRSFCAHSYSYSGGQREPERFPMHFACYRLFSRVLVWTSPYLSHITGDVDREILYRCFKALYDGGEFGTCLTGIDYGTIGAHQDQYWVSSKVIHRCLVTLFPRQVFTNRDTVDILIVTLFPIVPALADQNRARNTWR